MIPMLGQGYLYVLNRDRYYYELKLQKRKTFLLTCLIALCVGLSTLIWVVDEGNAPRYAR